MNKNETLNRIKELGLLAVLRGPDPELTLKMVDALITAEVLGIEITFTTPNALEVVAALHQKYGDAILLGMGTLTQPDQAGAAAAAGAAFLVSPHTETTLGEAMAATELPFMMGALTPSELMHARSLGADIIKIFPGSLGGPGYMKALRGPYPDIPMMPTGGVSVENVAEWFSAGAVAVGAGSKLCPKNLALAGAFDEITKIARHFVSMVHKAKHQK
jgi:2-dehydro-3-deoxyphosphogluconate aldolase/(4S)-4-hydroxy-2-oxoglutarate aldolase